jgi:hypothetical protein
MRVLAQHCSTIVPQSRYDQHFVMGKAKLELEAQGGPGAVTGEARSPERYLLNARARQSDAHSD